MMAKRKKVKVKEHERTLPQGENTQAKRPENVRTRGVEIHSTAGQRQGVTILDRRSETEQPAIDVRQVGLKTLRDVVKGKEE
jgi:hypothetical protein